MKRRLILCLVVVALIGWSRIGIAQQSVVPAEVTKKAQTEGVVRVIVQLNVATQPEGALSSPQAVLAQRQAIAAAQSGLLADLAGTSHRVTRQFEIISFIALEVGLDALAALERSARVVSVTEDHLATPFLAESVPLVEAPQAWAAGFDGTGQSVVVLDTGVDNVHPFLAGKVVEEACFSGNSNCPDGSTAQIGPGAGVPCTYAVSGCRHGTHVAGIAAGEGESLFGFSGVAKGASLIAIQVFSRFTGPNCAGAGEDPCALSFLSDQVAGLERVFALSGTLQISSVNMSLGGGRFFSQASCDAANPATKAAIDNLRSVGIATVIASGNNGFIDSMSAPGCISSAVSVGATTKTDMISSFSNSASFLSLLAPGSSINSSVPGGGFDVFSGTSMATPHVAGAWAILKQANPAATVSELLNALQSTGLPITDPRNGVTKSRIRIFQALTGTPGGVDCDTLAGCQVADRGSFAPAIQFNLLSDQVVHIEAQIFAGLGCTGLPNPVIGDLPLTAGPNAIFINFQPDPLPPGTELSMTWTCGNCPQTSCINYTIGSDPPLCMLGMSNLSQRNLPTGLLTPR